MHKDLLIYDEKALATIHDEFEVKILSSDCVFTEGPVWSPEGYYLFSDIPANLIYKIDERGKKEVFIQNSGTDDPGNADLKPDQIGSNALAWDRDGSLLICRHGNHSLDRYRDGRIAPFLGEFDGRPFNSPNDLIVHSDGRIYFSDPPYGLKDGKLNPGKYQPIGGVYCWDRGRISLVCDRYQYPNGVVLSPDEKKLYICSNKPFEEFVSVYDTSDNSYVGELTKENGDGIDHDRNGNVFLCNRDGLLMVDERGERLALLKLADVPANMAWGGQDGNDVLITARKYVLLIKNFLKSE